MNTKFMIGKTEYIVDKIEPVNPDYTHLIAGLVGSGKEAVTYFASKVLKSGKKSKQGGMFYKFSKTGNFIKVL